MKEHLHFYSFTVTELSEPRSQGLSSYRLVRKVRWETLGTKLELSVKTYSNHKFETGFLLLL